VISEQTGVGPPKVNVLTASSTVWPSALISAFFKDGYAKLVAGHSSITSGLG
jgi:hypothetical protein